MPHTFMPSISSAKELEQLQLKGLQWTLKHAYEHSPFYRQRLQKAKIEPKDIKSLADLNKIPFTAAEDLRDEYPFPFRAAPFEKLVRLHASSGTTGKRKVLCYTQKDIDDWADMFARCYEMAGLTRQDRVQIAVGYGLWTAGVGFQLGSERFGALTIPVGPGNMDIQCQMLVDLKTTVFCATASMALLLAEEIHHRKLKKEIVLKKIIMGAERHSAAMRRRIQELLGVEHVFDIPGLTELYGPGTGLDCSRHEGLHYWADYYILEIIDPQTLQPLPPGKTGEMVFTTLRKEGAPLIRYRSRDLSRLIEKPCSCGSVLPMHDRLLGRSDDMFIVRGVNVYPGQIDHVLSQIPEVGSEYQVHLSHQHDGRDYMNLKVELRAGETMNQREVLAQRIAREIKHELLVSPQVEVVDHGALPRTERKSRRVFDHRHE